MIVLVLVGIVVWLAACVVVVALCMSAKEGDRSDAALAEELSAQRARHARRSRARIPGLRTKVSHSRAWRVT